MSLIKVLTVITLFLVFYLALETIKRVFSLNSRVTRKTAHCGSGLIVIWLFYFLSYSEYLIATTFFIFFFIISRARKLLTSIHINDRITYGEIFYPIGVILVILLAYSNKFVAVSSIAILLISDTLAEYVGVLQGTRSKSQIGSLVFLLSATIVILTAATLFGVELNLFVVMKLIVIAMLATFVEAVSPFGSDNATIPLATVLSLSLLL